MNLGEDFKDKSTAFAIIIVVSIGIMLGIMGFFHPAGIVDTENDLRNWTTLVIEAGIGIFIAVTIVIYTNSQNKKFKDQQDEIAKLLKRIEGIETNQQIMINEQHSVIKNEQQRIDTWKTQWGELILGSIESIKEMYQILEDWLKDYQKNPSVDLKMNIIYSGKRNGDIVKFHTKNIEKWLPKIESHFKDPTLSYQLIGLNEQLIALFDSLHMEHHWESNLKTTFSVIEERKELLSKHIERLKKEIPQNINQN